MLKGKIEALLFSSGRKMGMEEISKLSRSKPEEIQNALAELKKEYDEKDSSVMLVNEGDFWKLTVREQFLPLVQKIVTETELSKTVTETLAVIAFKYPIKQSDLIKIRTNKAYDHLKELESMGYISRQKYGRTNLIKLTQKFFEYFNLPEEKLKDHFTDFASIAKTIEDKEKEIDVIKKEQKAKAEEEKQKNETINKEVELLDDEGHEVHLESYGESKKEESSRQKAEERLGELEVVDEPPEEELEEERERIQQIQEEDKKKLEEEKKKKRQKPKQEQEFVEEGLKAEAKTDEEIEKIVDEKVERILHPKENQEDNEEYKEKEDSKHAEESESEEQDLLEAEMGENKEQEKNNS